MGEQKKDPKEDSQVFNLKEENSSVDITASVSGVVREIPTVSTLLQRKKYTASGAEGSEPNVVLEDSTNAPNAVGNNGPSMFHMESEAVERKESSQPSISKLTPSLATPSPQTAAIPAARPMTGSSSASGTRSTSSLKLKQPPLFKKKLHLEKITLSQLPKHLRRARRSSNANKLSLLSFLAGYFSEITYFALTAEGQVTGQLGYGSPELVAMTRGVVLSSTQMPGLFQIIQGGNCFVGPSSGLRDEDLRQLRATGFKSQGFVGIFPVTKRKKILGLIPHGPVKVLGVWLCAASSAVALDPKLQKKILKLLARNSY